MATYALLIDDRYCALARDGVVLDASPSVVLPGAGGAPDAIGDAALARVRLQPTDVSSRHWAEIARDASPSSRALGFVNEELAQRLANATDTIESLWIAVPARFEGRALANVLSVARARGLAVAGFVDAATVTAAALELPRAVLAIDVGLHHVSVTGVDAHEAARDDADGAESLRRRRAVVSEGGGLLELYDAWLELASAAMVRRTRFDPLHEAASEQQLFDRLPPFVAQAARAGSATIAVEVRGERFEVALGREQLAEAGERVYREIVRALHELRPAGTRVAIVAPPLVRALPGLVERLQQFVDCELIFVPDGVAAAAASRLAPHLGASGDAVRWLRRLPRQVPLALDAPLERDRLGTSGMRPAAASHVLYAGRAWPLASEPIVVGRLQAPGSQPSIQLPEGLAAVSRRHCTLLRDGDDVFLVDHSRYGTTVNGERVAGRTVLRAGDTIRIGEPGVELALIAVGPSVA